MGCNDPQDPFRMKNKAIIYISGIDGCGKTTQATQLVDTMQTRGANVEYQWLRWEPSIVNALKALKKLMGKNTKSSSKAMESNEKAENKWHAFKQRLMRSNLFRKLWLKYASNDYFKAYNKASRYWNSDIIIMDRYIFDFLADQSINFNVSTDEMNSMFEKSKIARMHKPDINIIIDIPAETGFKRKMDGTSLSHLRQREAIYSSLRGENVFHVDGHLRVDEIQQCIQKLISEKVDIYNGE
jgi:thymidylate kinase